MPSLLRAWHPAAGTLLRAAAGVHLAATVCRYDCAMQRVMLRSACGLVCQPLIPACCCDALRTNAPPLPVVAETYDLCSGAPDCYCAACARATPGTAVRAILAPDLPPPCTSLVLAGYLRYATRLLQGLWATPWGSEQQAEALRVLPSLPRAKAAAEREPGAAMREKLLPMAPRARQA
jgi:hypothetical protein